MASAFAPSLACLYMAAFEKRVIFHISNLYTNNILLWRRYIDEILIFWKGGMASCEEFSGWVNALNPYLRFTNTMSNTCIHFLDLMITLTGGQLSTTLYKKPTDCNSLLLYSSHHPKTLGDNLPFRQFLQLRRNCSTVPDYNIKADQQAHNLRLRDYPSHSINIAKKRACNNNREALLKQNQRNTTDTLTCVTTFTLDSNRIRKIIKKQWGILQTGELTLPPPRYVFKRTRNLKDILVHTSPPHSTQADQRPLWGLPPVAGHFPCGSCTLCALTESTKEIQCTPCLNGYKKDTQIAIQATAFTLSRVHSCLLDIDNTSSHTWWEWLEGQNIWPSNTPGSQQTLQFVNY